MKTFEDVKETMILPVRFDAEDERAFIVAIQATAQLRQLQAEPDRWRKLWEENYQTARRGAKLP